MEGGRFKVRAPPLPPIFKLCKRDVALNIGLEDLNECILGIPSEAPAPPSTKEEDAGLMECSKKDCCFNA